MELQAPNNDGESAKPDHKPDSLCPSNGEHQRETLEPQPAFEEIDSTCSTPYVSAPSSPGRASGSGLINGGFFYSAPASPMHFAMTSVSLSSPSESLSLDNSVSLGFEFEFSARFGSSGSSIPGSMSSADELFLDGKIRPMKLSTHLERPQVLAPLPDLEHEDEGENGDKNERRLSDNCSRGRDLRLRDKSLRRRTRSLSPLRNMSFQWTEDDGMDDDDDKDRNESSRMDNKNDESKNEGVLSGETTPSVSGSSSRSSSAGRSSKRWVFLKDFLYRSKSEGRSNSKFWSTISFTPGKEKKPMNAIGTNMQDSVPKERISNLSSGNGVMGKGNGLGKKPVNGVGKRRVPPSPHELHYTANRAQAEEMRKKTFLPYRQGLLGCLGFSSKGYGAMNGFARALNPVSSR